MTPPSRIARRPIGRTPLLGDPIPIWSPPIKNAHYSGPELYPEFGAEGEILGGFRIARLIQESV